MSARVLLLHRRRRSHPRLVAALVRGRRAVQAQGRRIVPVVRVRGCHQVALVVRGRCHRETQTRWRQSGELVVA